VVTARLAVWLNALQVAIVERERRGKLSLSYTEQALAAFPGGTPLLSLDLVLQRRGYPNARTVAFLDGLLPEGEPRRAVAAELDLPASDVFGLLAAIGRDCAGALVIQPEDDPPPPAPTTAKAEPLHADELADLVANLRSAPLGIDRNVRLSLGGVQEKLLLARRPDGTWGRPVGGIPSTHILKPEIERLGRAGRPADTVENEHFCMRLAHHLGLVVAATEMVLVDERPVLVVERYDRVVAPDGTVRRVHQEDLCQAFGLPPGRKYESDGGPTLERVAGLLSEAAAPGAVEDFLRALVLNLAIGNCDAHAKNFSLLHSESGVLALAPLYDLISARLYPLADRLAMYVDTVQRSDGVTDARVVAEAARWGIGRAGAAEIVADTLERLPGAVTGVAEETAGVPEALVELVLGRVRRLASAAGATS
jgi:serine/threonine-protein kinase HipA